MARYLFVPPVANDESVDKEDGDQSGLLSPAIIIVGEENENVGLTVWVKKDTQESRLFGKRMSERRH